VYEETEDAEETVCWCVCGLGCEARRL